MQLPKIRYIKFVSKRRFGVELEVNARLKPDELVKAVVKVDKDHPVYQSTSYRQDFGNNYWHVKFDRSCGDIANGGGWEVASYRSSGYKDIENIGLVAESLNSAGAVVNNNCGQHVHVDIEDFSAEEAATLVAYWLKVEPVVLQMLPYYRRSNIYCVPLRDRFVRHLEKEKMKALPFWNLVRPKNNDNPNRRVSLNMCNYAHWLHERKTTELRLPECKLDKDDVKGWIRFFVLFVEGSRKKKFPKNFRPYTVYEVMKLIGLHNENPFFLLSHALYQTKKWIVKRLLANSQIEDYKNEAQVFLNSLTNV